MTRLRSATARQANDERMTNPNSLCLRRGIGILPIGHGLEAHATPLTVRILNQLVGAGTSVGVNYVEADGALRRSSH
jgi:hypothetical protein